MFVSLSSVIQTEVPAPSSESDQSNKRGTNVNQDF